MKKTNENKQKKKISGPGVNKDKGKKTSRW